MAFLKFIAEDPYAGRVRTIALDVPALTQADNLAPGLCTVVRGQVPILPGKVLVDEEQAHGARAR